MFSKKRSRARAGGIVTARSRALRGGAEQVVDSTLGGARRPRIEGILCEVVGSVRGTLHLRTRRSVDKSSTIIRRNQAVSGTPPTQRVQLGRDVPSAVECTNHQLRSSIAGQETSACTGKSSSLAVMHFVSGGGGRLMASLYIYVHRGWVRKPAHRTSTSCATPSLRETDSPETMASSSAPLL